MKSMHRTPRRARRGLTLLELVVGVFIAVFLTAAAVAFAAHETKLMGLSRDQLDMSQSSRAAIDLLASDLAMAGAGVGFDEANNFLGVDVGRFSVGSCNFNPSGGAPNTFNPSVPIPAGAFSNTNLTAIGENDLAGATYTMPTQDLRIRYADGSYATIANQAGTGGQFCTTPNTLFANNELVVLRTEAGDRFTTATIIPGGPSACTWGQCAGGCVNFTYTPTLDLESAPGASSARFTGGEVAGGYKTIVWFVAADPADTAGRINATLRRAVFDQTPVACVARDNTLGGAVAENVEALYVQIYAFVDDPAIAATPRWLNIGQEPLNGDTRFKTRADVELVMRTRRMQNRPTMPAVPMLRTGVCAPNTGVCNQPQDFGEREIFRTSVEIKNTGLFQP